jgi:hypothetical protein
MNRIPALDDITPTSARNWMDQMIENRLLFHPDDDPAEIIGVRTGSRLFDDEEVSTLREIIHRLFAGLGDRVYEIGCEALGLTGEQEPA